MDRSRASATTSGPLLQPSQKRFDATAPTSRSSIVCALGTARVIAARRSFRSDSLSAGRGGIQRGETGRIETDERDIARQDRKACESLGEHTVGFGAGLDACTEDRGRRRNGDRSDEHDSNRDGRSVTSRDRSNDPTARQAAERADDPSRRRARDDDSDEHEERNDGESGEGEVEVRSNRPCGPEHRHERDNDDTDAECDADAPNGAPCPADMRTPLAAGRQDRRERKSAELPQQKLSSEPERGPWTDRRRRRGSNRGADERTTPSEQKCFDHP